MAGFRNLQASYLKVAAAVGFIVGGSAAASASASGGSNLAQYALGSVLQDAAQVFGVSNGSEQPATSANGTWTSSWMSSYPDSTRLVHMNIPGTHDSATWNISREQLEAGGLQGIYATPEFFRCQNQSFVEMLEAGIRFFDLRYNLDPGGQRLVFWHSFALLSETATVENVLLGFYRWLEAHPSEAVIVSLQLEQSTRSGCLARDACGNATGVTPWANVTAKAQREMFRVLTSAPAKQFILQETNDLGNLGAARGKVVLFRRFNMDDALGPGHDARLPGLHFPPVQWIVNSPSFEIVIGSGSSTGPVGGNSTSATNGITTAYIEDLYAPADADAKLAEKPPANVTATGVIKLKYDYTTSHLSRAAGSDGPDSLWITFASAEHDLAFPPVTPNVVALGGADVGLGMNQQLLPFLQSLRGKRLGIVVLDFYHEPGNLVAAVLGR